MKKILLTLALAAFAFTANAQFVVGGNVGIDHSSRANDDYSRGTTNTNISILPKVGYQLNDQMQVGIQLGWDYNYNRWYGASAPSGAIGATDYASDSYESNPSSAIVLKPYFRYNFGTWKNFTLFCEAQANFRFGLESKEHLFIKGSEATGSPIKNADNYTTIGLTVVPGMNYAFSQNFSMDLYINLASLGWSMTTEEGRASHQWNIGGDFNSQTLAAHLNNFAIGFNYHF